MSKIYILDKNVFNKISAGEVVEKPASVVKELVENSLDAGANSIIVEIKNGGINYIAVSDNGCGIEKSDVKNAFLPHATSKIFKASDLENITTLGFRGEALASISAVSEIKLTTKTANESIGTFLEINGGEVVNFNEYACNNGTKIEVSNLFFNTPARRKFLHKPKTEESDITKIIEKIMLANPSIKIKYRVDGKIVYNTSGSGCYDNIYTIYGVETANNLIKVNFANGKYKLDGYIGKPEISKPNRTYQTLMINGRIIVNFMVSSAIQTAYENFLMKGKFPFYVLNLTIPFDSVDVNVHPSKQEVKFEKSNEIFTFFANAVSEALMSVQHIKSLESLEKKKEETVSKIELPKLDNDFGISFNKNISSTAKFSNFENNLAEITLDDLKTVKPAKIEEKTNLEAPSFLNLTDEITVIGVAFSTYIIVQKSEKLYFIDQHACHERKIYDELKKQFSEKEILKQDLMFPYTFTCNIEEMEFFNENLSSFEKLGFTLENFGNKTMQITQTPFLLQTLNLKEFIEEVKSNLTYFKKSSTEILKDFLAKKACKSASKAGDVLSKSEIQSLLADVSILPTLLCPHGRPIVVEVSKKEIEKWFKRIV